mmetsp:Transcript_17047/g.20825  ORF Transcript_17047/g.20825 Transcript_17047/m.20825 type:complete len:413 (+) Transcript_17047:54-1292(+)
MIDKMRQRKPVRKPKPLPTTTSAARPNQKRKKTKLIQQPVVVSILIVSYCCLLTVLNPTTIPYFYYTLTKSPCKGTCQVAFADENQWCGPVKTDRTIFVRIPKTGTTTVLEMFGRGSKDKSTSIIDLKELEDLTSSISKEGVGMDSMGYYDPRPEYFARRLRRYYKRASQIILRPPYKAQDRHLFQGHLHYFDFPKLAFDHAGEDSFFVDILPDWFIDIYKLRKPLSGQIERIKQISFVRRPQDRLASQYYYDRHDARSVNWRKEFAILRQNVTLEECLLDSACVEINELRRWCSVQVEMMCGGGRDCFRPVGKKALELAKTNARDEFLSVGIAERMNESLSLLQRLLPTYLEGVSLDSIPELMKGSTRRREHEFSNKAQKVLDDVCALDNELYDYLDKLFTNRVKTCESQK